MKELFETERSFLTVLHLISQEFFNALCELINAEDVQLIFSTAKVIYYIIEIRESVYGDLYL